MLRRAAAIVAFLARGASGEAEASPPTWPALPARGGYAVSCPDGFGELQDPDYFEVFGNWQSRYGRDSLRLSNHFQGIFVQKIEPNLREALERCPAFVLETMMNAVLNIDTENGAGAAREWLLRIYRLRESALQGADEENRMRLEVLAREWSEDIATVYPMVLGLQRLGPARALDGGGGEVDPLLADLCAGQRSYLYELEPRFYRPGALYCLQGQWGTEVIMHKFLSHSCNTLDPESADWFYVPLYATCMYVKINENITSEEEFMSDMDKASDLRIFRPLVEFLRGSKYYQRRQGRDHVFLFADGQGPRIWDSYDLFRGESVFLSPESKCPTWGEPVRRYVDVKPCLSSWKDIVIPGHTDFARIEYMRKQNRALEERRLLMTFHGRSSGMHDAYGDCAIRDRVMALAKHGMHVDVGGFVEDYPERKGDAHFCLVPAGTSPWTNHLYESFYAGCIPVILSDEYEVAFVEELDWPSFSIKWPEAEVGDALYSHLMDLTQFYPQRVADMKASLERHACWFNWYSTDAGCNPYALIHRKLARLRLSRASKPRFWNYDAEKLGGSVGEPPIVFAHLERPTRFKHHAADTSNFSYLAGPG